MPCLAPLPVNPHTHTCMHASLHHSAPCTHCLSTVNPHSQSFANPSSPTSPFRWTIRPSMTHTSLSIVLKGCVQSCEAQHRRHLIYRTQWGPHETALCKTTREMRREGKGCAKLTCHFPIHSNSDDHSTPFNKQHKATRLAPFTPSPSSSSVSSIPPYPLFKSNPTTDHQGCPCRKTKRESRATRLFGRLRRGGFGILQRNLLYFISDSPVSLRQEGSHHFYLVLFIVLFSI